MPVTQDCNQLFQTQRDLDQFLSSCQAVSITKNKPQFVSISFEIDAVDPLTIFDQLAQPNQLNFFFEKRDSRKYQSQPVPKITIAAIDAVITFRTERSQRFIQAKQFIQATLSEAIIAGNLTSTLAGPAFFCSFSFQSTPAKTESSSFPGATVFLPKWQIVRNADQCLVVSNVLLDQDTVIPETAANIWQTLQQIQANQVNYQPAAIASANPLAQYDVATTEQFKQSVQRALTSIANHQFDKIVLAHAVDIVSPTPFHQTASLAHLRRLHPDCYIFAVSNGKGQTFLGASPERLVCVQNRHLVTDALAGSTSRGQTPREDMLLAHALLNSDKDHHEHQVVVDFITRQLKTLGLSPEVAPLKLLQLSNIQHLHTPIRAIAPPSIHLLDILAELHPTPAVAGLPRDLACEEICRYEPFERSLYAAPIGWVNHRGDGEFIVGIRSALVHGCQARLFAGAGIVSGSNPDRELAEVQLKLQTLQAALV